MNVLVENSGRAFLCDFSLARLKADASSRTLANVAIPQVQGTRNWMAPELLNGSRIRMPSDVYAFSMTLYELYTDEIPFLSVPYADLFDHVVRRAGRPERPEAEDEGRPIPDNVWELAEQCWVADPHQRPTATQLSDTIKQILSQLPRERMNVPFLLPHPSDSLNSVSAEPRLDQCLTIYARSLPRATGTFTVTSSDGNAQLRLNSQEDKIELPVYTTGGVVEGTVELPRPGNISSVELTVACLNPFEGRVEVREVGAGGHSESTIFLRRVKLWSKADNNLPLPPSHSARLETIPGFRANIEYSISAQVEAKKKFGLNIGSTIVSTLFIYQTRSRPAHPVPAPLDCGIAEFITRPGWTMYSAVAKAHPQGGDIQDVAVKFYIPGRPLKRFLEGCFHRQSPLESRTFWVGNAIPFHFTFETTRQSLAWFRTRGPTGKLNLPRLQLMRQSSVGVRDKIWCMDPIGEGVFRPTADGARWMSFSGEIPIQPIKVTGFLTPLFSVTHWLMMTPHNAKESPFVRFLEAIPAQLTTDACGEDGH
ncbi:kinase-like domain-containing protein [Mycena rebaudengoi]|nr:kinase-like domain-containing protein [Mycena rebaudengoi]